jgi:hypothetical protein
MGACATASGPVRSGFGNSAFQAESFQSYVTPDCDRLGRAQRIKHALKRAGLTVSRASCLTGVQYGKDTPYYVPPTFLYKARIGITPHVCQLVALSQLTGYRFGDWMSLCGFDLRLILPLQLEVHTDRTAMITPAHTFSSHDFYCVRGDSGIAKSDRYFFVKVGSGDNVVYPKLLSGSVVRADRCYSPQVCSGERAEELLWLVEHPGGLACCHVKRVDSEHIVLLPSRSPLSAWPLRLSREARILGLIDLELRPRRTQHFGSRYRPITTDTAPTIPAGCNTISLSTLLRNSRARAGLTLRAAQQKTVQVAQLLRNPEYRIPLGLLSDYEAIDRLPRHIAKIISLCVVYGIDFWQLMRAGGSQVDDAGKAPLFSSDFSSNLKISGDFGFGSYRENVRHA